MNRNTTIKCFVLLGCMLLWALPFVAGCVSIDEECDDCSLSSGSPGLARFPNSSPPDIDVYDTDYDNDNLGEYCKAFRDCYCPQLDDEDEYNMCVSSASMMSESQCEQVLEADESECLPD
ncbi:MAG: hypothetical protein GY854_00475 [Deltaproteobacteria bacterium]|nr:hypothetical protein [Deltaproteobacteria bacterium]